MNNICKSKDIVDSIDEFDVFNSAPIFLSDLVEKSTIQINKYENRLDLLTEGLYKDSINYGLLGIVNRLGNTELKLGSNLKYIPEDSIYKIFLGE